MTEAGKTPVSKPPDNPRSPPPGRPTGKQQEDTEWTPPPAGPRPAPARPKPPPPGVAPGKGITFSFHKFTLAGLGCGLLMLGGLVFIGGFLSGVRFMLNRPPVQAASQVALGTANAPAGNLPPNTATDATSKNDSAAKPANAATAPAATAAPPAPAQAKGPEPPPLAAETADNLAIKPPMPMLMQPAQKPGDKPTLAPATVVVRANPLADALPPAPPSDQNQQPFALQVGVYLDPAEADKISVELQNRGYKTMILKTVDAGHLEWFRVRTGEYATLELAKAEAQAFLAKEGIPVEVVRQPPPPPK